MKHNNIKLEGIRSVRGSGRVIKMENKPVVCFTELPKHSTVKYLALNNMELSQIRLSSKRINSSQQASSHGAWKDEVANTQGHTLTYHVVSI